MSESLQVESLLLFAAATTLCLAFVVGAVWGTYRADRRRQTPCEVKPLRFMDAVEKL